MTATTHPDSEVPKSPNDSQPLGPSAAATPGDDGRAGLHLWLSAVAGRIQQRTQAALWRLGDGAPDAGATKGFRRKAMGEPLSDFVSRYLDAHRRRDADAVSGLYANEAQRSSPFGTSSGRAAVRGSYVNYWGSLSDDRMNINCVSGDRDDVVFIEWTQDAIHTAPFRSADGGVIEATGKSFTLRGLTVLEIADGLIAQERSYFDRLSLLAQLGLDGGPR